MNLLAEYDASAVDELAAAHFDERTPFEAGFAEIFERDFKSRMLRDIKERRAIGETRGRRLKIVGVSGVLLGAAALWMLINLLNSIMSAPPKTREEFVMQSFSWFFGATPSTMFYVAFGLMVSWFGTIVWAYWPSVGSGIITQDEALQAVVARFGFRYEKSSAAERKAAARTALHWPFSSRYGSERKLVGALGHSTFDAWIMSADQSNNGGLIHSWFVALSLPVNFDSPMTIGEALAGTPSMSSGMNRVTLESPDFAKRFVVYAKNQVDARVVLTPDVMDHLTHFRKPIVKAVDLRITINGNRAELLIPMQGEVFVYWNAHRPAKMIEELHKYFTEIGAIIELVRDIDAIAESEGNRGQLRRNLSDGPLSIRR